LSRRNRRRASYTSSATDRSNDPYSDTALSGSIVSLESVDGFQRHGRGTPRGGSPLPGDRGRPESPGDVSDPTEDHPGDRDRNRVTRTALVNGTFASQVYYANETAIQNGSRFYAAGESYRRAIVFDGQFEGIAGVELGEPTVEHSGDRTVLNYTITGERNGYLAVTEGGLIVAYRIEQADGGVITYRVRNVNNTTVQEPDWVDQPEDG
jgi:hypothetical protein